MAHVDPATSTALAKSQLTAQGIKDIVHRTWIATDANQADVILLRVDTTAGAVSRYRSATAAKADAPGQLHFDVPGSTDTIGYYSPVLDELGDVRTIVHGQSATSCMRCSSTVRPSSTRRQPSRRPPCQLRLLPL